MTGGWRVSAFCASAFFHTAWSLNAETRRGGAATKVPSMKIHAKNDSLQISSEWWRKRVDCAPVIGVHSRLFAVKS